MKAHRRIIHEIADDPEINKTPDEVEAIIKEKTDIQRVITAAKAVGAIALLLEFTDFLNIDASEYIPYSVLLR